MTDFSFTSLNDNFVFYLECWQKRPKSLLNYEIFLETVVWTWPNMWQKYQGSEDVIREIKDFTILYTYFEENKVANMITYFTNTNILMYSAISIEDDCV